MSEYAGYVLTFNLLGIINEDIGPDANYVWIATGYTLAVGVSSLLWGRLSDIFGRRWFFIGGNVLALLGSILGAAAPVSNPMGKTLPKSETFANPFAHRF
jgi:MFS family permease